MSRRTAFLTQSRRLRTVKRFKRWWTGLLNRALGPFAQSQLAPTPEPVRRAPWRKAVTPVYVGVRRRLPSHRPQHGAARVRDEQDVDRYEARAASVSMTSRATRAIGRSGSASPPPRDLPHAPLRRQLSAMPPGGLVSSAGRVRSAVESLATRPRSLDWAPTANLRRMKVDHDQAIRLEVIGPIHAFGSEHHVCADPYRAVDPHGGLADARHSRRAERPQP